MLQRLCMPSLERVGGEPATNSRSHSHAYIFLKVSGRSVLETSCMHWYPSNDSLKSPSNLDCRIYPPKHDSEAWKAFADLESRYPLIPFGASMKAYSLLPDWNAGDTSLNPIDLQVRGWLQNNTTNSSEVSSSYIICIHLCNFDLSICLLSWSISISILLQFHPSAPEVSCHFPHEMVQARPTSSSSAVTVSDWSVSISKKTWAPICFFRRTH